MNRFSGFPSRPEYVPIPKVFFSDILPVIEDPAELAVSLQVFRLLAARRGYPRAVSEQEVLTNSAPAPGFSGRDQASDAARGLEAALNRGTFIRAATPDGNGWVLLNTEGDRRAAGAIAQGLVPAGGAGKAATVYLPPPTRDIFTLYEQTIGLLSPMIAERLQEAEQEYPAAWVQEAFRAAEEHNKRSWRYVETILERWKTEGRDDGKPGRNPPAKRVDYSGWVQAARRRPD